MIRRVTIVGICLVVLFVYANSLSVGYILDDIKVIQQNETIRSFRGMATIFRDIFSYTPLVVKGNRIDPSYRPVRFLSYALDYQITRLLYGEFEPSSPPPLVFHLTNMILHALSAILVFHLARHLLGGNEMGAAICALLFAAHPVQTEAVTYLSGRRDVLFALFYLLAILAYLRSRWILCLLCFVLSLFTKEMAATLPAALFLLGKPRQKGILGLSLVMAVAFSAWKVFLKNPGGIGEESVGQWGGGMIYTLMTIPRVLFHYLGTLLWPAHLSVDYSYDAFPPSRGPLDPPATAAGILGLILVTSAVLWAHRKGSRIVPLGAAWFLVTLLPVLQIFPHPERMAERFLYLPSMGLFLVAAWAISRPPLARFGWIIAVCLITPLGVRTIVRNADWQDPVRLWSSAVERHPRCARARAALGAVLMERGRYADAKPHLDACLEIIPLETEAAQLRLRGLSLGALFNRAVCHYETGHLREAMADYERLLQEKDAFGAVVEGQEKAALVHFNLGAIHFRLEEYDQAITQYRAALEFESSPDLAIHMREAHVHLAQIYYNLGDPRRGVEEFLRALALGSGDRREMRILFDLGEALRKMGSHADAVAVYEAALERDPASREIRYRLAQVRIETDMAAAEAELMRILEDHPDYLPALYSMADIEFRTRRFGAAEARLKRILRQDPTYKPAYEMLDSIEVARLGDVKVRERDAEMLFRAGIRKLEEGKPTEAASLLEEAIQVDRGHAGAREALARIALEVGKVDLAETHLRAIGRPGGEARRLLADILRGKGEDREALRILEEAVRDGQEGPDLLVDLIDLYRDLGETEKAGSTAKTLIERWPDSPQADMVR